MMTRDPRIALGPVYGRNKYCGPSVISALAGVSTDHAARIIRQHTGRRSIKSTTVTEVLWALRTLGLPCTTFRRHPNNDRPTLNQWLGGQGAQWIEGCRAVLVMVTGHWICFSSCYHIDSSRDRSPKHIRDMPGPRRRVVGYAAIRG